MQKLISSLESINMLGAIDHYFLQKEEPVKGCLLFLRNYILSRDPLIAETWKYSMPMYCYKGKMMCYLWVHKKTGQPYLGIVEGQQISHPGLLQEKRSRMKIFLIDPAKDLPVKDLDRLLVDVLALYRP